MGLKDVISWPFKSEDIFGKEAGDPQTLPQSPEAIEARKRLSEIARGPLPKVPRREIAPIPPMGEERKLARTTAKELIQPQELANLPGVQEAIEEARIAGSDLGNRLARMLQSAGALTSTGGANILGRVVKDVQRNIASIFLPLASEERARRTGLIPELERLGLTEEERARGVTQAEKDALFQQQMIESEQVQTFLIPLLQAIIGQQPGLILPQREPGLLEQLAPLIGPALGGVIAASDSRVKENFARIEDSLEKVNQLEGLTYNFINKDFRSAGIIAQELEKVLPEGVVEHDGLKFIRLDAVIALLVNAVKELNIKIESRLN